MTYQRFAPEDVAHTSGALFFTAFLLTSARPYSPSSLEPAHFSCYQPWEVSATGLKHVLLHARSLACIP